VLLVASSPLATQQQLQQAGRLCSGGRDGLQQYIGVMAVPVHEATYRAMMRVLAATTGSLKGAMMVPMMVAAEGCTLNCTPCLR
jgi:hypothetical protein